MFGGKKSTWPVCEFCGRAHDPSHKCRTEKTVERRGEKFTILKDCPKCQGEGEILCQKCDKGQLTVNRRLDPRSPKVSKTTIPCPDCTEGKIQCPKCKGLGKIGTGV